MVVSEMRTEQWLSNQQPATRNQQKNGGLLALVKRKFWASSLGFTLIELSMVLVIIGFLAGAVVVGKDLIKASEIRAQVSQMEKLNTAVTTFRIKYNGLPGDLLYTTASAFGFFSSSFAPAIGNGDGNDVLEQAAAGGCGGSAASNCFTGEYLIFFRHLSDANLIEGSYSPVGVMDLTARFITTAGLIPANTATLISQRIPPAKIGHGAYITVNSYNQSNYFTLLGLGALCNSGFHSANSDCSTNDALNPLSAQEASKIDDKIDNGKPNSGKIKAVNTALANIDWNKSYWVTTSTVAACVTGGTDYTLSNENTGACSLSFRFP